MKPTEADIAAEYAKRKDSFTVPGAGQRRAHPHLGQARRGPEGRRGREGEGRGHRRAGEGPGRGLREARQREHGRSERQDERRPASALLARPDGSRVRGAGLRDGARRDPRSDQDAVRLPHHQVQLEDAGSDALARRSAPAARPPSSPSGWPRPRWSGSRASSPRSSRDVLGTDDELRKLQIGRREPATRPNGRPRATRSRASAPTRSSRTKPGASRSARSPRRPSRRRAASPSSRRPRSAPAGLPAFAELKPRLEQDWKAERREKDALAQLEPAAKELVGGRHARGPRAALRNRSEDHDRVRPRRPDSRDRRGAGAGGRRLPDAAGPGRSARRRSDRVRALSRADPHRGQPRSHARPRRSSCARRFATARPSG